MAQYYKNPVTGEWAVVQLRTIEDYPDICG